MLINNKVNSLFILSVYRNKILTLCTPVLIHFWLVTNLVKGIYN